jgi:L-lysine exporter family protein LysE/ArgO
MTLNAFVLGFSTSLVLIVAIGAQNAFVLRQGLRREHVLPVVALCGLSDAVLISAGVAGLGALVERSPALLAVARYGGALFLLGYAVLAMRRALAPSVLRVDGRATGLSLRGALAATLGFTFLNPHVYLDTVVLLGAIGAQQPAMERPAFVAGALLASLSWFFGLGYGARLLAPWFAKASAWRVLDAGIALTMASIAFGLLRGM